MASLIVSTTVAVALRFVNFAPYITVSATWQRAAILGFVTVLSWTTPVAAGFFLGWYLGRAKHDIRIFEATDSIMSENALRHIAGRLRTDTCLITEDECLVGFRDALSLTGNQYINAVLRNKASALEASLTKLTGFIEHHYSIPDSRLGGLLVLYPGLKSQLPEFVNEKGKECMVLVGSALDAYADYRQAVKNTLLV
jgi:hypothetical protein